MRREEDVDQATAREWMDGWIGKSGTHAVEAVLAGRLKSTVPTTGCRCHPEHSVEGVEVCVVQLDVLVVVIHRCTLGLRQRTTSPPTHTDTHC
jgi:hypothetical protein